MGSVHSMKRARKEHVWSGVQYTQGRGHGKNMDDLVCSVYSMKRTRKKDAITSVLSIANEKN